MKPEIRAEIRRALQTLPSSPAETTVEPPMLKTLYVPQHHARALDPDSPLVTGMRGAGKSFWCAALTSADHRRLLAHRLRRILPTMGTAPVRKQLLRSKVAWGFGEAKRNSEYPDARIMNELCKNGADEEDIWRTIILWQLSEKDQKLLPGANWRERVENLANDVERSEAAFSQFDKHLSSQGMTTLIVFDALDRLADDWKSVRQFVRALLRLALEFRAYRSIRLKVFMRQDMFEDEMIWQFSDSSKLHLTKVDLAWTARDLFGLLWQYLANADETGHVFRQHVYDTVGYTFIEQDGMFEVDRVLQINENFQRRIFQSIAGEFMGRDRRRGRTYTWLPNHLGDAAGHASPRSFLVALRTAADESKDLEHRHPLHYEAIKRGVVKASEVRRIEMREDYPWIAALLEQLRGVALPCHETDVYRIWKKAGVLSSIQESFAIEDDELASARLPPRKLDQGEQGIMDDLIRLNVVYRTSDKRINIPDVYRIGFGLVRRGGVRPTR